MIIMLCGDGFRVQVEGFIVADAMLVQACSTRRGEAGVPVVKVPNVPNVKMEQLFRRTSAAAQLLVVVAAEEIASTSTLWSAWAPTTIIANSSLANVAAG